MSFSVPHLMRPAAALIRPCRAARLGRYFSGNIQLPRRTSPRGVSAEIGGGQSLVNRPKMTTFGLEKVALIHVVVRRVRQSVVANAKRLRECPPPIARGARSRTQGPIHEPVVVYRSSGIGRSYRSPRFL